MRITKAALKQIIQEETKQLLEEIGNPYRELNGFDPLADWKAAEEALEDETFYGTVPLDRPLSAEDVDLGIDPETGYEKYGSYAPSYVPKDWRPDDIVGSHLAHGPTSFEEDIKDIQQAFPISFEEKADELENEMVDSGVDEFEANMLRNQWLCNKTTPQEVLAKGGKCAQGSKSFSHHEFVIRMAKLKQKQK